MRWSEKYTKTDMVYLASGGFWLSLSNVVVSVISFGLVIAFANLLPKSTYGTYNFILSIFSVLAIFTIPGINTALCRSVSKDQKGLLLPTFKHKFKWGLLGTLSGILISIYYYIQGDMNLSILFLLAAVFIPIFEPANLFFSYIQGKKNFKEMGRIEIISRIITAVIMLITVFVTQNILYLVSAYLISWSGIRLYYFWKTHKFDKEEKQRDELKETISYGNALLPINMLGKISGTAEKVLLWHFLGPSFLATYTISLSIPTRMAGFMKIINRLAFPKLSNTEGIEIKSGLLKKILLLIILMIPIYIIYAILVIPVFNIFFPAYTDAILIAQIAGLILLIQPLHILRTLLNALGKVKEIYVFNILSFIFKVITLFVFIIYFGLVGAMSAYVLGKLFDGLLLVLIYIISAKKNKALQT